MHFPNNVPYWFETKFSNNTKEKIKSLILENLNKNGFSDLTVSFQIYKEKNNRTCRYVN